MVKKNALLNTGPARLAVEGWIQRKVPAVLAALVFALLFLSCDNFFSNSWGKSRSYKAASIDLDTGNLDSWIGRAVGDRQLADSLVNKILAELASGRLSTDQKNAYSNAGLELAVESSGLGESILTHATGTLSDLLDDAEANEDMLKDIFGKVQGDFNGAGGGNAAAKAADIMMYNLAPGTSAPGAVPTLNGSYSATSEPAVLGEVAMVLVLGSLGGTPIGSLDDWSEIEALAPGLEYNSDVDRMVIAPGATPDNKTVALAACLNLMVSEPRFGDDPVTGAVRDAFFDATN